MQTTQLTARPCTARCAPPGDGPERSVAGPAAPGPVAVTGRARNLNALRDLAIDLGIPLGSYYLLRDGLGLILWLSLAASSVGPAVRSAASMITKRELNLLATLMLTVNVAGIAVSFLTGDPRTMIAKDAVVSSVIGLSMLGSVALGRPLMTRGLRPWMTRGEARREAAWDHLHGSSATFRRLESAYTIVWGVALLGECVARCVGAYTLPVTTMAWLGTVMTLGAIGVAIMASGAVSAGRMLHMVERTAGHS
jgi:hypothetical protein